MTMQHTDSTTPGLVHQHSIESFFTPRSIAVIGATERANSVGRALMFNLMQGKSERKLFPVNPKHPTVFGLPAFSSVASISQPIDLAVIATPAPTVPDVIQQCAAAHVPAAIIISAGFKEHGAEGAAIERRILEISRGSGMRIIGPNCLGVMNPFADLNATFAGGMARRGNVAFLSQSGALCSAILDWSLRECVGFSAFVSTGSMLDVSWGDLIDYLADDPRTKSILIYMESIGDARSFLSAAREAALTKPIVVLKAGRSEQAAKAATSHTGAMAGSDEVLDAAFRRAGVLRVNNVAELFYMAEVLSKQPRPTGRRLTIVTNAGGAGVLATDALINAGGELASLSSQSIAELSRTLPAHWSHGNPIDILGDADGSRFATATQVAINDPNTDGVMVVLTPQEMSDPTATASSLTRFARSSDKPIIANWMGGDSVEAGATILREAGIPVFRYPDTAARAFQYLCQYTENLRAIYETPSASEDEQIDRAKAASVIAEAQSEGRELLTEDESKRLVSAYGIETARTQVAQSADEAVRSADQIGYPVVLKLHSKTITHKSDVGGVMLNIVNAADVRAAFDDIRKRVTEKAGAQHFDGVTVQPMIDSRSAYELILGSKVDPQFGPVILFGAGGEFVELMKDRAIGLPPLNATLARRIMEQTKISRALHGFRGRKPVDQSALEHLLVRFSQLVLDHPRIKEIELNPLLVSADRFIALDARVVLYGADVTDRDLPRPSIRPYPQEYVAPFVMKNGSSVLIRPIRPEDEPLVAEFHKTISETSVQRRYFHAMSLAHRTGHERLSRVCFNDYDREICLVAEQPDPTTARRAIIGIARLSRLRETCDAEFAIVISDQIQHQGLGTELLKRLLNVAEKEHIARVSADVLRSNSDMLDLSKKTGFVLKDSLDGGIVRVVKEFIAT